MPDSTANLIDQINYKANFGYTKSQYIPNPTFMDDNEACNKYSEYVRTTVKQAINVWFDDTGIEQAEAYTPYNAGIQAAVHPSVIANSEVTISNNPVSIPLEPDIQVSSPLPTSWKVVVADIMLKYSSQNSNYTYLDTLNSINYIVYWSSDTSSLMLDIQNVTTHTHVNGNYPVYIYPKLSLRTIAKTEYSVPDDMISDIDNIIRSYDRSRYTADEFYPLANLMFSSRSAEQSIDTAQTARSLHYHRNPHHLQFYTFNEPTGGYQTVPMFQPQVWVMIADWLATPGLTVDSPWNYTPSPNPFVYYYGSKYLYEAVIYHDAPASHPYNLNFTPHAVGDPPTIYYTYSLSVYHNDLEYWKKELRTPMIAKNIHVNASTDTYIQNIVKRWMPVDDGNMPHPNYAEYPHVETIRSERVIYTSGTVG